MKSQKEELFEKDIKLSKSNKGNKNKKGKRNGNKTSGSKGRQENGVPREILNAQFRDGNHPEWYKLNEQLARDTASLPFTYALGTRFNFGNVPYTDYSLPGVARLNYAYTYGYSVDNTSPLNLATRNIYSFLKSVNSRAKTYDANDLGLYIMCIDQAHAYYEFMKRLYGLINTTNVMNRYAPRALVEACGGNYDDLLSNVVQLREYINTYAVRLSTMPMPKDYSIFERHGWLNRHVWVDSNSTLKSQAYAYTPISYGIFDLDEDGAGYMHAKLIPYDNRHLTFQVIKTIGEEILSAILYGAGEEDFNIIGGDILYGYGKESVRILEMVPENYTVLPQYDTDVLNQIHNARFYGIGGAEDEFEEHFSIIQSDSKNFLITSPQHTVEYTFEISPAGAQTLIPELFNDISMPQPIDLNSTDSSVDRVLVATRLMTIPNIYRSTDYDPSNDQIHVTYVFEYSDCASEIGQSIELYYYATDTGLSADWTLHVTPMLLSYVRQLVEYSSSPVDMAARLIEQWNRFAQIECFDQHPLLFPAIYEDKLDEIVCHYSHNWIGDMNNNTYVTHSELSAINNTALMAMFGVDKVGNQQK